MTAYTLFASSGRLGDLRATVSRFYCGTSVIFDDVAPDVWQVTRVSDGRPMPGVRIVRKRGRYRFEGAL